MAKWERSIGSSTSWSYAIASIVCFVGSGIAFSTNSHARSLFAISHIDANQVALAFYFVVAILSH
jgi:hypothetical protein